MTGFRVRLDALRDASDGVDGLLANVRSVPLRAEDYGPEVVGDARLAAAVATFLTRWSDGVDLLVGDAAETAALLRESVAAYEDVDGTVTRDLVTGSGPDPAAD